MNSTQTRRPTRRCDVDMKLEVVVIPVSDVDRAKRFYEGLGWRLDADFAAGRLARGAADASRLTVLHLLRQGAHDGRAGLGSRNCFSSSTTSRRHAPSSSRHGADVSEVFHFDGISCHRDAGTRAGPGPRTALLLLVGLVQRSRRQRLAAAGGHDAASRTRAQQLRRRDADRSPARSRAGHGEYEATAPKHHWSGWYAAYIVARQQGKTPEEAAKDAARHMETVQKSS